MGTLVQYIGLVSESSKVGFPELCKIAAAVGKQVQRDFYPIWGRDAVVSAFASTADIPSDYWPVKIQDDIGQPEASGFHTDANGQPYALCEAGPDVSTTVSHETLEMLADPFGNRLIAGQSPVAAQGRVRFLCEVCDPSEAQSYTVNGVQVSDFYCPEFFDPVASTTGRYSYLNKILAPRTILPGGYLSWMTDDGKWWQQTWFDASASEPSIGGPYDWSRKANQSLREMVDEQVAKMKGNL
jgi:hypothetical protein